MINDGVDIIDIGGESSRPGSLGLSVEEELSRVIPVIKALSNCGKPISIDTYKPVVMREAINAGIHMINDIRGFREPGALEIAIGSNCGICIMHMQEKPENMQIQPQYHHVVTEVTSFLHNQVNRLQQAGVDRHRIIIDPGFGFGKNLAHNIDLLKNVGNIQSSLDLPLMVGVSRKTMLGELTDKPIEKRLSSSLAAALISISQGAKIIRVHDVEATIDAIKVWQKVMH